MLANSLQSTLFVWERIAGSEERGGPKTLGYGTLKAYFHYILPTSGNITRKPCSKDGEHNNMNRCSNTTPRRVKKSRPIKSTQSRSGYGWGGLDGHQQEQQPITKASGDSASGSYVSAGRSMIGKKIDVDKVKKVICSLF